MSRHPTAAPFDPSATIAALAQHGVAFVIVGGLAVVAHGFERSTGDLDIIPAPDRPNLQRLHSALASIDAHVLGVGDFELREMPLDLTVDNLALHGNWRLSTRHGILDLLQHVEPILETPDDFDGINARAVSAHIAGHEIRVVGYHDLLEMKVIAGRDQDLIDIRALREANGDTAP